MDEGRKEGKMKGKEERKEKRKERRKRRKEREETLGGKEREEEDEMQNLVNRSL